jgi:hypothetical protein
MAGDLLAVDHSVLRKGAYLPTVLINGQLSAYTFICRLAYGFTCRSA